MPGHGSFRHIEKSTDLLERKPTEETKFEMSQILKEIQDGTYAEIVAKYRRMILTKSDLKHIDK